MCVLERTLTRASKRFVDFWRGVERGPGVARANDLSVLPKAISFNIRSSPQPQGFLLARQAKRLQLAHLPSTSALRAFSLGPHAPRHDIRHCLVQRFAIIMILSRIQLRSRSMWIRARSLQSSSTMMRSIGPKSCTGLPLLRERWH